MKNFYQILIMMFTSVAAVNGQDIHLSNYQPAGILFNPAQTADIRGDVQLGVQYRRQWTAITEGYTTMGAAAEVRGKYAGLGLHIIQNHAGEASVKTTGLMLSGAYHKQLARKSLLSLGIGLGRVQKRINPAALSFDSQYIEGQGFDETQSSGEFFERTTATSTDFSIGLKWKGSFDEAGKYKGRFGFSLTHVHLPDEGFKGALAPLPMRTFFQAGVDLRIDRRFTFSPDFLYMKQGVHQEILGGISIGAAMDPETHLHIGMAYRLRDAVIGKFGVDKGNKSIWLSYDATTSKLKSATANKGAWEIGLYIRFDRNRKKVVRDRDGDGIMDDRDKCPKVPGIAALDGCPEMTGGVGADADGDGVSDDLDRCPLEPGLPCFYGCNDRDRDGTLDQDDGCPEIFGPPENQGCPVNGRDSDRDGIPDSEDYCVFLKGSSEFYGCPDSDRDGISDIDDECPYIKGSRQNNGCPDDAGREALVHSVTVEFETDQNYIHPGYRAELDEFIRHVRQLDNFRLVISGHTDAEGNEAYNYELGLRRAKIVQDYLWRNGIPFEQVRIISYGEAIPKRDNYSSDGKARNRRAEVMLYRE